MRGLSINLEPIGLLARPLHEAFPQLCPVEITDTKRPVLVCDLQFAVWLYAMPVHVGGFPPGRLHGLRAISSLPGSAELRGVGAADDPTAAGTMLGALIPVVPRHPGTHKLGGL